MKSHVRKLEAITAKLLVEGQVSSCDFLNSPGLFNLRGSDIPPMFYAYAAVGLELNNVTLIVNAEVDTSGIEADLTSAGVTIVQNYTGADEVFKNIVKYFLPFQPYLLVPDDTVTILVNSIAIS